MYYLWGLVGISGNQWEPLAPLTVFQHFLSPSRHVVFTGTYHRSLDNKLRVLLPKRLRQALAADAELFLTPGTENCLEMHTQQSLDELAERARQSHSGSQNLKSFSRLFYARARHCEVDTQGRVRVPGELADLAGLEKEIVFVGVGYHWEIWNLNSWNQYLDVNNDCFDQIVQNTFDPGSTRPENRPITESVTRPK